MGKLYIERWLHYRGWLQCFSATYNRARETGCSRAVASLYSDHLRQIYSAACVTIAAFIFCVYIHACMYAPYIALLHYNTVPSNYIGDGSGNCEDEGERASSESAGGKYTDGGDGVNSPITNPEVRDRRSARQIRSTSPLRGKRQQATVTTREHVGWAIIVMSGCSSSSNFSPYLPPFPNPFPPPPPLPPPSSAFTFKALLQNDTTSYM